jgi:hypothetical protein
MLCLAQLSMSAPLHRPPPRVEIEEVVEKLMCDICPTT